MSFSPGSPLAQLLAAPMRAGRVVWLGVRPERRLPMVPASSLIIDPIEGLPGDHYRSRTGAARQVTLIQQEHIFAIAAYLDIPTIAPELLRRNVVVCGINLLALKGCRFQLGTAVLQATGECHPCSRMEEVLGVGGYNAVRGHGGITARIISGGEVRLGDAISRSAGG